MILAAPPALLALAILPPLYFILRLTPPAARRVKFPPLVLLRNLAATQQTPHRLPLLLLLLRLAAVTILILGFAGPTLRPPPALPGTGPILLVIDDGWASAYAWPQIIDTAQNIIAATAAQNRGIAILTTTHDAAATPLTMPDILSPEAATRMIAALEPKPWPPDRAAAAALLRAAPNSTRIYIADGITDGPDFTAFLKALNPTEIFKPATPPPLLGPIALTADGALTIHAISNPAHAGLRAESATGNILATAPFDASNNATITLPTAIANKITRLRLDGPATAGGTLLTDATTRATAAGLVTASASADTPYLGTIFFLGRALPQGTKIITGTLSQVLASKPGLICLADVPLPPSAQTDAKTYIANGGVLIRFAGPLTAQAPDALTADPLISGDRRLGGALTWTTPEILAPFPENTPFSGIPPDPQTKISQQILADPAALESTTVWAALRDGTPLILGRAIGRGYLVNILTTANTDWSNFALSGSYPAILARLAALGRGSPLQANSSLPLSETLDAFGALTLPTAPAAITASNLGRSKISASQPPGLYGSAGSAIALNLGNHVFAPISADLRNATPLGQATQPHRLGPMLIALATALLILDLAISLTLRGGLKKYGILLVMLLLPCTAQAQNAALQTELGYILTKDAAVDQTSSDGLTYLSASVSTHSSVQLGPPIGLTPGTDDLSLYPLLYWPLLPNTPAPSLAACNALSDYMNHGGLLVIDTRGGDPGTAGSGAGFAPGAAAAFTRVTACLNLPPLEPLTTGNVLAHSFYIIPDFPGRFTGAGISIATPPARDADGVTPVIVGQNDWAGAWARDPSGTPEQIPLPGGEAQRTIADRFGINLVIYALTGSYKSDQNAAPALLSKLGQ